MRIRCLKQTRQPQMGLQAELACTAAEGQQVPAWSLQGLPYGGGTPCFCKAPEAEAAPDKLACVVCGDSVDLSAMRTHLGAHMVAGHLSTEVCGFG